MDPKQFRRQFRADNRLERGAYFSSSALGLQGSDHVGVVLMSLGGPRDRSDFEEYLYSRWMDPILYARGPALARHPYVRILSRTISGHYWGEYEEIGGECPSVRLVREQASALESKLNARVQNSPGVRFSTFVAMRHGRPSGEDTLRRMRAAGVTKVLLLPMYPQYSLTTTGTSLAYWSAIASAHDARDLQTTAIVEYSAHPLYVQAVSERMDQALQRFPRRMRPNVEIVFCAEHEQSRGHFSERDSFCDLAQTTVTRIAELRGEPGGYEMACFSTRSRGGSGDQRYIRTVLDRLAGRKVEALLVVPLGHTTDHVWTANALDIQLRQAAADVGIGLFEVAAGLNCHPLFIAALADIVEAHVSSDGNAVSRFTGPADTVAEGGSARPRGAGRSSGCPMCRGPVRARDWGPTPRQGAATL